MYIKYLYATIDNKKSNQILIGAHVVNEEPNGIKTTEVYLGEKFSLVEFMHRLVSLNIKTAPELIVNEYNLRKAQGIVYFPQTSQFTFLVANEIVVTSVNQFRNVLGSFTDQKEISLIREKN